MAEVKFEEQCVGICANCGKEFTYIRKRRERKFCSQKCRNRVFNVRHCVKSRNARFERDPEYKKQVLAKNSECIKRRTAMRKEAVMVELIDKLAATSNADEIRSILEQYTRLKASLYRGRQDA